MYELRVHLQHETDVMGEFKVVVRVEDSEGDEPVAAHLGAAAEPAVDWDIDAYDTYQQHVIKNTHPETGKEYSNPLTGYERAAIKTYIAWKLGLGPADPEATKEESSAIPNSG